MTDILKETEVEPEEVEDTEVTDYSPIELAQRAGVKPQMIYNYIQADRIPAFTNDSGNLRVKASDADEWLERYETNKVKRETKRLEKLQAELEGNADNA